MATYCGRMSLDEDQEKELRLLVRQMAREHLKSGVTGMDDIVGKIHDALKKSDPTITNREVRDLFNRGPRQTQSQLTKQLNDFVSKVRLTNRLEDVQKGIKPDTEPREPPSPEAEVLRKQVAKAMREQGFNIKSPDEIQASMLKAYKTRMQNKIDDLERRIRDKDFEPEERNKVVLDTEANLLKSRVGSLKNQLDSLVEEERLKNRDVLEKTTDYMYKWRRAALLSGVSTLAKLQGAAASRIVTRPFEQAISGLASQLPGVKDINEAAGGVGNFNVNAEIKAIAQTFSKESAKAMWNKLTTGHSTLDELYGKPDVRDMSRSWLDWFGQLHGAIKEPARQNEWRRSFELRLDEMNRNGLDLTDPVNQATAGAAAYADANRAIFMNANRLVNALRQIPGSKGEFPILAVPTNYITEVLNHIPVLGAIKASGTLLNAVRKVRTDVKTGALEKGSWEEVVRKLEPDQAQMIMRTIQKQGVGMGLMTLGYFAGNVLGGYPSSQAAKEGVDERGLKEGEIGGILGWVPHALLHNPAMEMINFGATIRHVNDEMRGESFQNKGWETLARSQQGLIKNVPFLETPARLVEAARTGKTEMKFASEAIKGAAIPRLIQDIANGMDPKEGENFIKAFMNSRNAQKRAPETLMQGVETGIPKLRENVPMP